MEQRVPLDCLELCGQLQSVIQRDDLPLEFEFLWADDPTMDDEVVFYADDSEEQLPFTLQIGEERHVAVVEHAPEDADEYWCKIRGVFGRDEVGKAVIKLVDLVRPHI